MGFLKGVLDVGKAMKMDDLHAAEIDGEAELKAKLGHSKGEISYAWFEMEGLSNRKDRVRAWRKGVKSLNGWTDIWTSLHWAWIAIIFVLGIPFWAMGMPLPWFSYAVLLPMGLWGWGRRSWKGRRTARSTTYKEIDGEMEMAATPRPPEYEEFGGNEGGGSSVVKSIRPDEIRQEDEREIP